MSRKSLTADAGLDTSEPATASVAAEPRRCSLGRVCQGLCLTRARFSTLMTAFLSSYRYSAANVTRPARLMIMPCHSLLLSKRKLASCKNMTASAKGRWHSPTGNPHQQMAAACPAADQGQASCRGSQGCRRPGVQALMHRCLPDHAALPRQPQQPQAVLDWQQMHLAHGKA